MYNINAKKDYAYKTPHFEKNKKVLNAKCPASGTKIALFYPKQMNMNLAMFYYAGFIHKVVVWNLNV